MTLKIGIPPDGVFLNKHVEKIFSVKTANFYPHRGPWSYPNPTRVFTVIWSSKPAGPWVRFGLNFAEIGHFFRRVENVSKIVVCAVFSG